eukprot:TRINITY_DN16209_c0_g1_i1.p1 TRINITY_DN16209_c0_g1~~TRINITY_DN16209_c0_g1_i1.p1  ORF type:complete len:1024 (+),score=237.95 TRINITY_DN16209_c0_g1_i1:124-3195(+)
MELLKNLHGREVDGLCRRFGPNRAHDVDEFSQLLKTVPSRAGVPQLGDDDVQGLFLDIDMKRSGKVTWDMFTMHVIDVEMASTRDIGHDAIRNHVLDSVYYDELPMSVKRLDYFPTLDRLAKHIHRGRQSIIKFCDPQDLSVRCQTTALGAPSLCAEVVPGSVSLDSLVVGCRDMTVSFWEYNRRGTILNRTYTQQLEETQTVFRWVSKFNRLLSGSRSGTLSVWSAADTARPMIQDADRIHHQAIMDVLAAGSDVFTASLDCMVKCTDVERGQVKLKLSGHEQGVCRLAHFPETSLLASAGFELDPYVWHCGKKDPVPTKLEDKRRPHRSHIIGLESVDGTSRLMSADASGLVKVWDMRTLRCSQSFLAESASQHLGSNVEATAGASKITSICSMSPHLKLAVSGKALSVFRYDQTSQPHLADDKHVTIALYNSTQNAYLTATNKSVKIWDGAGRPERRGDDIAESEIVHACLDPDGRRLFLATANGVVQGFSWTSLVRFLDVSIGGDPIGLQWNEGGMASEGEVVAFTSAGAAWVIPGSCEDRHQDRPVCLKCVAWAQAKGAVAQTATPSCATVQQTLAMFGMYDGHVLLTDVVLSTFIGVCIKVEGAVQAMRAMDKLWAVAIADASGHITIASTRQPLKSHPVPLARWALASPKALARSLKQYVPDESVVAAVEATGTPSPCRILSPPASRPQRRPRGSRTEQSEAAGAEAGDAVPAGERLSASAVSLDYDPAQRALYCGDTSGWVQVYSLVNYLHLEDVATGEDARGSGFTSAPPKHKRSSSIAFPDEASRRLDAVPLVRLWLAHSHDVSTMTFLPCHQRLLTASYDSQVLLWSLDGVVVASLQQGGAGLPPCQTRPSIIEHTRLTTPGCEPLPTPAPPPAFTPRVRPGKSPGSQSLRTAATLEASSPPGRFPQVGSLTSTPSGAEYTGGGTFLTDTPVDTQPSPRRDTLASLCPSSMDGYLRKPKRKTVRMAARSAPPMQQLAPTTALSSPATRFAEIVPTQPVGAKPKNKARKVRYC